MNKHLTLLLLWVLVASAPAAQAQMHAHHGASVSPGNPPPARHQMAGMAHATGAPGSPTAAFHQQMDSVMAVMDSGMQHMGGVNPADLDASFAAMMVPHHQGAVDMARLQLLYGKDPELRRLAQSIIAEQQLEIQQMQAWLRKHPAATTSLPPTRQ